MIDQRDEFLELASDCFGDNAEKKYAAYGLLDAQLRSDHAVSEDVVGRLQAAAQRQGWLVWGIPLILVLVGLFVVAMPAYQYYRYIRIMGGGGAMFGMSLPAEEYEPWKYYFRDLSGADVMLLFGDVTMPEGVKRKEGFWQSEPENAGAYIEYLTAYRIEHMHHPNDMLVVAKELDEGNAYYYYLATSELTKDSTEKVRASSGKPRGRARRGRKARSTASAAGPAAAKAVVRSHVAIRDEGKYKEALRLFYQAVEMPKCSTYSEEMMLRRLPLLEMEDHDWMTRMMPFAYLASQYTYSMPLMRVSQLIRAEAYRCEKNQDAQGLNRIVKAWEVYCRHIYESGHMLVDALVLRALIHAPCEDFHHAAKACDLPDVETYFKALKKRMDDEKDERYARAGVAGDHMYKYASILSYISVPMLENQLNNPEMIPQPDYRPDRLADYAFWNRVVSALHWLALLLIALIAWLWRFRSNVILRGLGRRLATLFSWRDWAFVVVTGVLIPMGLYWLVHGTETAVSAQRYNLIYSSMLMPGGQVGSLFLLLVLVPILMVTLRLKKMLPVQVVSLPRMIFLAVILAAVSMPVFGLAGESKDGGIRLTQLGFGLQALAVALVLASPVVALFRRKHEIGSLISKAVRGQLVVGVYMIAAVVVVLQMPIYHALEKHWVAEDEIFKISREHTSFSNMESLVTKHLYMELDELLSEIERDMTRLMPSS